MHIYVYILIEDLVMMNMPAFNAFDIFCQILHLKGRLILPPGVFGSTIL